MPRRKLPAKPAAPPPKTSLKRAGIALACVMAAGFGLFRLASAPSSDPSAPPPPSSAARTEQEAPLSSALSSEEDPLLLAPSASAVAGATASSSAPGRAALARTYVGADRCAGCHKEQHRGWERDWHSRALSPAKGKYVVGDFKHAHFKGSSSEAWMSEDKARYTMRTQGSDGALGTFPISWVIGGKRMQDTVTAFPDGRWQVLPVYFHVTGKGDWVDYTETKQGALGPDHPFFWANFRRTANRECLDCHVTGMNVTYERKTRSWTTQMADAGVSCESCHGPGGRHADSQLAEDIVHPAKVAPEVGFSACAQCHGPRNPLFPLLDASHRFIPGQRYEDFFQPHGLVTGSDRSGDFFVDGRPKTSSFEVQALMQSRCYLKGKATCLSCHSAPHGKHDADEMRPPTPAALAAAPPGVTRADMSACSSCHKELFAASSSHSHHKAKAAQSCIACHMPKVVTGVLDEFADHAIDIPVPDNTSRHHIPNACNTCHSKETPEAMTKAIASLWPSSGARTERRLRLADAFDEATRAESRPALAAVLADASEAPLLRGTAATLFAQRFPEQAGAVLTPLLKDPDSLTRAKAAEALGAAKVKDAAGELAARKSDPSLFVREAAAIALATLADPGAEAALRELTSGKESGALPRPHALLGFTLARRGDIPAAITELERATELSPYYVDALVMLADLYAKTSRMELTLARVEEALTFDPLHEGARKRLAMLNKERSVPAR